MGTDSTIMSLRQPDQIEDTLTAILRNSAPRGIVAGRPHKSVRSGPKDRRRHGSRVGRRSLGPAQATGAWPVAAAA